MGDSRTVFLRGKGWVLAAGLLAASSSLAVAGSVWKGDLYQEAGKWMDAGEYGKAYGILEKALKENETVWTPREKTCVGLALSSSWIQTSPLSVKEAGQMLAGTLRGMDLAGKSPGLSAVCTFLEGDASGAAALFDQMVKDWESLGKPGSGRERAEYAGLARAICLGMTGDPVDAEQGIGILAGMGTSSDLPNAVRKGATYAGAMLVGSLKRNADIMPSLVSSLSSGYEPNMSDLCEAFDVLVRDEGEAMVRLSDVPDPWNPVRTGFSTYVSSFAKLIPDKEAETQCRALVNDMGAQGQYQMGLFYMSRGDYDAALRTLDAYLSKPITDDQKTKALARSATCGVKKGDTEGLGIAMTSLLKAFDFQKYGGAFPVMGDLLIWAYGDAETKTDELIQGNGGDLPTGGRLVHLQILRSMLRRAGSLAEEDVQGAYEDLQTVIKKTARNKEDKELARYVARQMARTLDPGSSARQTFDSLGAPEETFNATLAIVSALDELMDGNGKYRNALEWQEFVATAIEFTDREIGVYEAFLKRVVKEKASQ